MKLDFTRRFAVYTSRQAGNTAKDDTVKGRDTEITLDLGARGPTPSHKAPVNPQNCDLTPYTQNPKP